MQIINVSDIRTTNRELLHLLEHGEGIKSITINTPNGSEHIATPSTTVRTKVIDELVSGKTNGNILSIEIVTDTNTYMILAKHIGKMFVYNTDIKCNPLLGTTGDWSESILIQLELKRYKTYQAVMESDTLVELTRQVASELFAELLNHMGFDNLQPEYNFQLNLIDKDHWKNLFVKDSNANSAQSAGYAPPPPLGVAVVTLLSNKNIRLHEIAPGVFNVVYTVNEDTVNAFSEMRTALDQVSIEQGKNVRPNGFKRSH